jgi:hypothetical protein
MRRGDYEVEIQGWMSTTEIEKRFSQFRRLTKKMDGDIKVILPAVC